MVKKHEITRFLCAMVFMAIGGGQHRVICCGLPRCSISHNVVFHRSTFFPHTLAPTSRIQCEWNAHHEQKNALHRHGGTAAAKATAATATAARAGDRRRNKRNTFYCYQNKTSNWMTGLDFISYSFLFLTSRTYSALSDQQRRLWFCCLCLPVGFDGNWVYCCWLDWMKKQTNGQVNANENHQMKLGWWW